MLNTLPLAIVALLPLANARFHKPRAETTDDIQCCPCLPSALNPSDTTVTVTVTSPRETVTVEHTIVQPATTVFVTQTYTPDSPAATQEVTVHPEPSVQTETFIAGGTGIPDTLTSLKSATTKTVTKTIQFGGAQTEGSQPESPKTVTVTINPDQSSPNAKATLSGESNPAGSPSVAPNSAVTVTISQAKQFPSAESPSTATVTFVAASESAAASLTTTQSVKTVTFVQNPDTVETVTDMENPASLGTTTVTLASNPSGSSVIPFVANPADPSTISVTLANNLSNSSTETVTFAEIPVSPSTATVTLAGSPSGSPSVQTASFAATLASSSAAAAIPASSPSNNPVQTVPFVENPPKPSSTTETPANNSPTSVSSISTIINLAAPNATVTFIPTPLTISSPLQPAITAPPQVGTIPQNIDQFTTLTQTVTSGNTVNIEITIINIFTGETTCRKKGSGKPCDSEPKIHASGEIGCLTTGIFTKTATAFNTVVVTVESGIWTNDTSATEAALPLGTGTGVAVVGTGSTIVGTGVPAVGTGSPMIRRSRMPMIRKRL